MSTTAKVFLGILFVLSIAYLALSSAAFSIRTNWHKKFDELNKQYDNAINTWNRQSDAYKSDIEKLNSQIQQLTLNNNSQQTLVESKDGEISRLTETNASLSNQIATANTNLAAKETSIADKEKVISDQQRDISSLNEKIKGLEAEKSEFRGLQLSAEGKYQTELSKTKQLEQEKIKDVKKIQELEEVLATLNGKGVDVQAIVSNTAPLREGRVMAVDPDLNLVMISLGVDDEVKPGYHFYAHRNGEYVGEIVIDKVDTDAAFGRIVPSGTPAGKFIQSGDSVTTQLGS